MLIRKTREEFPDYTKLVRSNTVLGWHQLIYRSDQLELDDLNIRAPYRCQGLGALIIDRVKQEALLLKLPVKVTVQKENSGALRFYHRHNFKRIDKPDGTYLSFFYQRD